jgi:N-acetylglucosamine-6-sulfatase
VGFVVVAALLLPAFAHATEEVEGEAPRPNVIMVLTDDQTRESFNPAVMPRAFDLLAKRGVSFTNAVTSTPQCCPSRAGLLTGQYAHNNGVVSNQPGYSLLTRKRSVLPSWLQAAGYRTAHVGKFLNGYVGLSPAPGWDEWVSLLRHEYVDPAFSADGSLEEVDGYLTSHINQVSADLVARLAPRRQPFYLQINQLAPHVGSGREPGRCSGAAVPAPRDDSLFIRKRAPVSPAVAEIDLSDKPDYLAASPALTGPEDRELIDRHYGCALGSLRSVDRGIDRIAAELRAADELTNTMIVLVSDNGYAYGEHRVLLTKGMPYEEHLRVPLAIRPPKSLRTNLRPGAEVDAPVATIDLVATILQLAGGSPCAPAAGCRRLDGRSLVPLLRGRKPDWVGRRAVPLSFDLNHDRYGYSCRWQGVRTPTSMAVEHAALPVPGTVRCEETTAYERYDLEADPFQLESLAPLPALIARLRRLARCSGIKGRDLRLANVPFCE